MGHSVDYPASPLITRAELGWRQAGSKSFRTGGSHQSKENAQVYLPVRGLVGPVRAGHVRHQRLVATLGMMPCPEPFLVAQIQLCQWPVRSYLCSERLAISRDFRKTLFHDYALTVAESIDYHWYASYNHDSRCRGQ